MNHIIINTTAAIILGWHFPCTPTQAAEPSDVCGLYTKIDAEALLKQTVTDGTPRKTVMPAGDSCRYTYSKNGDTYSLKLRVSNSDEIKEEGIQDSASDVMERQEKARMNNPYAAKKFQKIPNLGSDAFWSGEDLWVLKDDTLLIISVHSFLDGSFQDMEAAQMAREEQDKTMSLEVAKTVLGKLN